MAGGQAFFTSGDATVEADIDSWIKSVLQRHGRIDILINNVGQSERLTPEDADTNIWRAQLALNLDSAFYCTRAVLPAMINARKGAIVNISSVAGIRHLGKPQIGYNTAKAALQQLTKDICRLACKRWYPHELCPAWTHEHPHGQTDGSEICWRRL